MDRLDLSVPRPRLTFSGTLVFLKGRGTFRQPWTKSDAGYRTVILPCFAVDMLLGRKVAATANLHDAIFPSRRGTWLPPNNVRRQWREARKDSGLDWVTPHTFRKTVATLLDREADTNAAAAQLGHAKRGHHRHLLHRESETGARRLRRPPVARRRRQGDRVTRQPWPASRSLAAAGPARWTGSREPCDRRLQLPRPLHGQQNPGPVQDSPGGGVEPRRASAGPVNPASVSSALRCPGTGTPAAPRSATLALPVLRLGASALVRRRRWVAGLTLLASAAYGVVAAYQFGLVRHLPQPPLWWLDADRVDASGEAYAVGPHPGHPPSPWPARRHPWPGWAWARRIGPSGSRGSRCWRRVRRRRRRGLTVRRTGHQASPAVRLVCPRRGRHDGRRAVHPRRDVPGGWRRPGRMTTARRRGTRTRRGDRMRWRLEVLDVERAALSEWRAQGRASATVLRAIERSLDLEETRLRDS